MSRCGDVPEFADLAERCYGSGESAHASPEESFFASLDSHCHQVGKSRARVIGHVTTTGRVCDARNPWKLVLTKEENRDGVDPDSLENPIYSPLLYAPSIR